MNIVIVGASGATGRLLVRQLLDQGHTVKAVVRSTGALPQHERLMLIEASVLNLSDADMAAHLHDCDAVASCLGHNLTWRGLFGPPRRLVTEATRRLCQAVQANQPAKPVRFVLMNTTGNRNHDRHETVSLAERCIVALLRLLLPPQADNEDAANYLRTRIGQNNPMIEWAAVRPDGLINEEAVSAYEIHPSPTRSAIFNAGRTSRVNVAHFMAALLTDDAVWAKWKGQMPVIYNKAD